MANFLTRCLSQSVRQIGGALVFYTVIPMPSHWPLEFSRIARWAPWVGLLIGGGLVGLNRGLAALPVSDLGRGVLVTILWVAITGGLHLDGAIDTADGLAAPDPDRRLAVMSDSRTGAYGVIAAVLLILLKVAAIADLPAAQMYGLLVAPMWGRWGQLMAIARYPYLKAEGKGAFHQRNLQMPQDLWPSLVLFALVSLVPVWTNPHDLLVGLGVPLGGAGIAWGVGLWLNHRLGGMTGDTYGAIVEWTEALLIAAISILTK